MKKFWKEYVEFLKSAEFKDIVEQNRTSNILRLKLIVLFIALVGFPTIIIDRYQFTIDDSIKFAIGYTSILFIWIYPEAKSKNVSHSKKGDEE